MWIMVHVYERKAFSSVIFSLHCTLNIQSKHLSNVMIWEGGGGHIKSKGSLH